MIAIYCFPQTPGAERGQEAAIRGNTYVALTSTASTISLASMAWPLQPHFTNTINAPDCWIFPGKKITNIGPFLWN